MGLVDVVDDPDRAPRAVVGIDRLAVQTGPEAAAVAALQLPFAHVGALVRERLLLQRGEDRRVQR